MTPAECREELRNAPCIDAIKTAIQSVEDDLESCRGGPNLEERRMAYAIRDALVDLLGASLLKAEGPAASAMSIRLSREAREVSDAPYETQAERRVAA